MKKIKIQEGLINLLINSHCKLYSMRYQDIKYIFGAANNACELKDCIISNYIYIHQQKMYMRYASYIEGAYQDILYKLAILINNIVPYPSLAHILYIYDYILRNGYLSINNKLIFQYPKLELDVRRGLSIITGSSVCRNFSNMLTDLLYYFNIYSVPILTDRLTKESDEYFIIEEFEKIKSKNDDNENNFMDYFNEKVKENGNHAELGNHSEVLILSEPYYLLDPTTISLSKIVTQDTGYHALDFIRIWSLYAEGKLDLNFSCTLYETLKKRSLKVIKNDHIIKIQKQCFNDCEKNKEKIKDFHKQITTNINFLNEQLQYLKK